MALQTRTRKLAATQAALNSRTGRATGATTPADATPSGGWFTGYSKNIPSILLVIAGVVVFFVGIYNTTTWSNPSPASVGSWSQNRWFALLILWGIVAALVRLNAEKAAAKTLQWVLAGVVAAVLVVFPLWGLATSPAAPARVTSRPAEIPLASMAQPKTLTIPPGVGQKSERILVPFPNRLVMLGEDYRANCKYNDGHEESFIPGKEPKCSSGDVQFVYATNLKEKEENTIAYYYRSIR